MDCKFVPPTAGPASLVPRAGTSIMSRKETNPKKSCLRPWYGIHRRLEWVCGTWQCLCPSLLCSYPDMTADWFTGNLPSPCLHSGLSCPCVGTARQRSESIMMLQWEPKKSSSFKFIIKKCTSSAEASILCVGFVSPYSEQDLSMIYMTSAIVHCRQPRREHTTFYPISKRYLLYSTPTHTPTPSWEQPRITL